MYGSVCNSFQHICPAFPFHSARQQFYVDRHVLQELAYSFQMLFSQNFSWRHDDSLESVAHGYQHGEQSDKRLARTYVALQQTVHLLARAHVVMYFAYHAFLCVCQFEFQIVFVEHVERLSHGCELVSSECAMLVVYIACDIHLHIKQLFKFQTFLCRRHLFVSAWIVYPSYGIGTRNEVVLLCYESRESLLQFWHLCHKRFCQSFHSAR